MANFLVIITLLTGSIGLMLFVIGSVFTLIVAFGNQQKLYGFSILLFLPISLIYCAKHWDIAAYSGRMVFSGAALLTITAIILKLAGLY
ncbi:hypothetical protein ACM9HF_03505 [Colwellia sp. RE-S-Sl-9]